MGWYHTFAAIPGMYKNGNRKCQEKYADIQLSFMFLASTRVLALRSLNDGLRLGCVELTTPFFHKFFLVMLFITAAERELQRRLLLENSILV